VWRECLEKSRREGYVEALTALAPHFEEAAFEGLEATRRIDDVGDRARATAGLVPLLQGQELHHRGLALLASDWALWVRQNALNRREKLIDELPRMLRVIEVLGGSEVLKTLARSILDVVRWWP
jgi:hypothetical protein